jgi:cysteine-rich repeat protein
MQRKNIILSLLLAAFSVISCKGECGDGVLDDPNKDAATEACDDGNPTAGDGCAANCTVETGFVCAGAPSACALICSNGALDTGEQCDDGNAANGDGCAANCSIEAGFECNGAPSVCALSCGDGASDAGEQCDDGNAANGDGCSSLCAIENGFECDGEPSICSLICGNGALDAGEQCDDGNNQFADGCDGACFEENGFECAGEPSVCTLSCGDATLDAGEGCDDGDNTPGDGCAANCSIEAGFECNGAPSLCVLSCGDNTLDAGEGCDDGDRTPGDGCNAVCQVETGFECSGAPSLCVLSCGDNTLDAGEGCDDGDITPGDGCNAACQIENGFACNGEPSVCVQLLECPDGNLDANETCDDNNTVNGDGCSGNCQIESGFLCVGQPSVCVFVCGNGTLEGGAGESCDDGNLVNGDGCAANCQAEPGFTCLGQPSVCTGCGNNVIDGADVCDGAAPALNAQGVPLSCGDFLFSAGTVGCLADCSDIDLSQCQVVNGDGLRTPLFFVPGVGEQCDDGNVNNGDGCSAVGILENTTTVIVNPNQAQLNNTTAAVATKSVFGTIGGVDLNNDGLADAGFDLDVNGVADASLLVVVSTDRVDICDEILLNGGFNGFLTAIFNGQIDGTITLTFLQIPANQFFAVGSFTGTAPLLAQANTISVDAGYIITTNGTIISDTTIGTAGTGTFNLQSFLFNPVTLAGTIAFFTQNIIQATQFSTGSAVTINQPISVSTTGASSCTLEFLQ